MNVKTCVKKLLQYLFLEYFGTYKIRQDAYVTSWTILGTKIWNIIL